MHSYRFLFPAILFVAHTAEERIYFFYSWRHQLLGGVGRLPARSETAQSLALGVGGVLILTLAKVFETQGWDTASHFFWVMFVAFIIADAILSHLVPSVLTIFRHQPSYSPGIFSSAFYLIWAFGGTNPPVWQIAWTLPNTFAAIVATLGLVANWIMAAKMAHKPLGGNGTTGTSE